MSTKWTKQHGEVIRNFLRDLNRENEDFVLKGGTALYVCYGLNRFSEDIDLDSRNPQIEKYVKKFCEKYQYEYRVAKNTDTVKRFMIHYGSSGKPLKIEVSYRSSVLDPEDFHRINDITVYKISALCDMKASAYAQRDKIRDVFDLSYICTKYWDELDRQTIRTVRNNVAHKGIEQFDYMLKTQDDELIDKTLFVELFLEMYDKLGLISNTEEQKMIEENKESLKEEQDELEDEWEEER